MIERKPLWIKEELPTVPGCGISKQYRISSKTLRTAFLLEDNEAEADELLNVLNKVSAPHKGFEVYRL